VERFKQEMKEKELERLNWMLWLIYNVFFDIYHMRVCVVILVLSCSFLLCNKMS
jgi:hypothetical protein